jgi:AI-2 transport protein TqsA
MSEPKPLLQPLVHGAVLAVLIGWVLFIARDVLIPVAFGIIVVYIISGLTRLLGRIRWIGPRLPAPVRTTVSLAVIGAALWGMGLLVIDSIGQFTDNAAQFERAARTGLQQGATWLGIETEPSWNQVRQFIVDRIGLTRLIGSTAAYVLSVIGLLTVVALYAAFLLLEQRSFDAKIDRLSRQPGRAAKLRAVIGAINDRVGNYLALKTLLSVVLGFATWAVMAWLGIGFAGLSGLLAGLTNYIPYVGSIAGVAIPVLLALLQGVDGNSLFWVALLLGALQFLNGNALDPYLMGNSLNLSPFVILFSLAAWAALWGLAGALLAVPFAAIMVIVFAQFDGTRPLAVLLSRDGRVSGAD